MDSLTDQELLKAYVEAGDEVAFSEVVRRHVDLVYSVASRIVCDAHLAEDVSQRAFTALAQHASSIPPTMVLAGWLHQTAHHIAANVVRAEVRRRAREQQAIAMNDLAMTPPDPSWTTIAQDVDDVLCELSSSDRDALVLRYFQGLSASQMATTLGISSEAAQKRVYRALDRMRQAFSRRGTSVGAASLAILMASHAVQAAPRALASSISASAIASVPAQISTISALTKIIVMTTFNKVLVSSVVLAVIGTAIYHARPKPAPPGMIRSSAEPLPRLERTKASAAIPSHVAKRQPRTALLPRAIAPKAQITQSSGTTAARPFPSTQLYQFLKSKAQVLTSAQLAPFLQFNDRSPAALLAAFRTTTDSSLLAEAMQRFASDPQVSFEAAIRDGLPPDSRRQWLDAFKQADPENSLASYLSAADRLKSGELTLAIQDLNQAASLSRFQDYSEERIQDDEQAYLAAGYTAGQAKLLANNFVATPYLSELRELGQGLVGLAATYQNSGDVASSEAALEMAIQLGRRLSDPEAGERLNAQLIGISIEKNALSAMAPSANYLQSGQTVQQRLDLLTAQKESIHVLTGQADSLWRTLSEQDWVDYHARLTALGEAEALQWLVSNYGHP